MVTQDGTVYVSQNDSFEITVLESKIKATTEVTECDLQQEWQKLIDGPIHTVSIFFSQSRIADWNVVVHPHVHVGDVDKLHAQLVKIDPSYSKAIMTKEHLSKCKSINCCGELKTPLQYQEHAL
eukprot:15365201-Ditylum_brightwellii.AAC.1